MSVVDVLQVPVCLCRNVAEIVKGVCGSWSARQTIKGEMRGSACGKAKKLAQRRHAPRDTKTTDARE